MVGSRFLVALFAWMVSPISSECAEPVAAQIPMVPDGFQVSVYAREPLVRNPCAMAFDVRGRLFVGQGPQYRSPKPETQTDRVTLLIDQDGDGAADKAKTFAEGFNNIQGLAWYGDQLWVANAPDLTVVRDVDGDDQADEYQRIYGGLGNLEHGLHGLVFAPDGRLYMSKGNSKGYQDRNSPERFLAPAAFTDLWGMETTPDAPTGPEKEIFARETYRHGYHHPSDDWGTEGGMLRCNPDGTSLEVFSRGMRNMWDVNFDADFNWVGTDQDQDGGDRILNPFPGAHFGWGHAWSPHWTGENHPPTSPISGPVFHGSGTGVVFGTSTSFPERYRNAFFCADWLNRSIFIYRPGWQGGLMRNMAEPEVFAKAPQGRSMGSSVGLVFDPTDIEFGPDGALWVLSWGHGYGAKMKDGQQIDEGRVYRISYGDSKPTALTQKHRKDYSKWTTAELVDDLRHDALPVRRSNAQAELVRRGPAVIQYLEAILKQSDLPPGAFTWTAWTLGQIESANGLQGVLTSSASEAQQVQILRILGYRSARFDEVLPDSIRTCLRQTNPRIRCAAIEAIDEAHATGFVDDLWELLTRETDHGAIYRARIALGKMIDEVSLRERLTSASAGQRQAALLTLLELDALSGDEVLPLRLDSEATIAEIASSFVSKVGTSVSPVLSIRHRVRTSTETVTVEIVTGDVPPGLHIRYSLDGTEPTDTTGRKYGSPFVVQAGTTVSAALFKGRERMGPVLRRRCSAADSSSGLLSSGGTSDVYPVEVSDIRVTNDHPYRIDQMQLGRPLYSNRNYVWLEIPDGFRGHTMIQSRNSDSDVDSTGDRFLSFTLDEDAEVYIAHDRRIQEKPDWLNRFVATEFSARSRDTTYDLFVRRFPAGAVTLGGNTRDGSPSARSQYICIIKPASLQLRETSTTIRQALAMTDSSSYRRGASLFFGRAGCAKCHRIGSRGNAFAPNLTNLGTRAAAATVAESILKPSAVITEGFHSVAVVTDSGQTYSGFIKQESGLNVELVQADGRVVTIPRTSIEARRRQQISVMPEGLAKQLSAQQVADLVKFIKEEAENPRLAASASEMPGKVLAQGGSQRTTSSKPEAIDTSASIRFQEEKDVLKIRCGSQELATYFLRHDKVRRPFFAHVKAPDGTQVTRNFPPAEGEPADHADMHPGLWLAFGDLHREDFWRNKGYVVHEGFTGKPTGGAGTGSFTERKCYRRADDSIVCYEEFRCVIRILKEGYLLEWDSTFSAPPGSEFYFGDQEEMGLGIRVATPLTEINGGLITDSEGRRGAKHVWSQSSRWCDYSGKIGDRPFGVSILCHPDNFRQSWMHARNYGVLVANAFGRKAMRKGPPSHLVVKSGETLRIRYGVLLHGPVQNLDSVHQTYVRAVDSP